MQNHANVICERLLTQVKQLFQVLSSLCYLLKKKYEIKIDTPLTRFEETQI